VRSGNAHVLVNALPGQQRVGVVDETVVTNDQGISLAVWMHYTAGNRIRLEWAAARPGKRWTDTKVTAVWQGTSLNGFPQLATSSHHRITAIWLERGRVVVANWSPVRGWAEPARLSTPPRAAVHTQHGLQPGRSGRRRLGLASRRLLPP
jgi:hypothetical protein